MRTPASKPLLDDVDEAFVVRQFELDMRVLLEKSREHRLQDHRH